MEQDRHQPVWPRVYVAMVVLMIGAAFAFANGMSYNTGNLRQYLLHGLHALNPTLLATDWFTTQTTPHHSAFGVLITWLGTLGPLDVAFGLANALCAAALVTSVYFLVSKLYRVPLVVTAVAVLVIVFSPPGKLGWTAILNSYFQPSTIGGVGFLMGLVCLVRGRHLWAGLAFFLAALFHGHYMMWITLIVGSVVLVNLGQLGVRRALRVLVPIALAVAYHLPFLATVRSPDQVLFTSDATRILHEVYAPFHYRPLTWGTEPFLVFGSTLLAGIVALIVAGPASRPGRMLLSILCAFGVVVGGGIFCTTIVKLDSMAWLFPYRLVPFLCLASQILVAGALVRAAMDERVALFQLFALWAVEAALLYASGVNTYGLLCIGLVQVPLLAGRLGASRQLRTWRMCVALLSVFVAFAIFGAGPAGLLFAGGFALAAFVWRRVRRVMGDESRWRHVLLCGHVAVPLVIVAFTWRLGTARKDFLGPPPEPAEETQLYDWCKNHSDVEDVFIVPPGLGGFRLGAERSVMIEWKCIPVLPKDMMEWHRRLVDECGSAFASAEDAADRYLDLNFFDAVRLARIYDAEFLVTCSDTHRGDLHALPRLYENEEFTVYDLRSHAHDGLAALDKNDDW